ncbi:hypothetical protein TIFTF001_032422 [Ficus carica]|uniref:DDE Tnp4 domain-containing protein n=1 Tax=Ficus carica TaxID=3494 RepID=A0AA88J6P6_FICCA|nr:hypothetical protein TIFTF001_032422 [Ficus carica]
MNRFGYAPHHDEDAQAVANEQCDDDDMLARAVVAMINSRWNRRRVPQPMHDSILTGSMRVEEILNGHEDVIQGMISMKSSTFRVLSNLLGATNRHISYLFQHSQETTSRWFFRVLKVICALKDEFIRRPDYTMVQPLINEHEGKYRPWFDCCIGAIDGTHVPCVPRHENADGWINRKGFHSQNILAACSFDMKFTYMLAGYEGSCHDAKMLDETIAFHGFPMPPPDDTRPSTGTEQHGSSTGAMNQMRERMADAMWERYQSYPWYRAT